jgi:glutathione S-transferase
MTTTTTKILSGPLSMFGAKVQIAALEKGIPFELTMVPFTRTTPTSPSTPTCCASTPSSSRCRC